MFVEEGSGGLGWVGARCAVYEGKGRGGCLGWDGIVGLLDRVVLVWELAFWVRVDCWYAVHFVPTVPTAED